MLKIYLQNYLDLFRTFKINKKWYDFPAAFFERAIYLKMRFSLLFFIILELTTKFLFIILKHFVNFWIRIGNIIYFP